VVRRGWAPDPDRSWPPGLSPWPKALKRSFDELSAPPTSSTVVAPGHDGRDRSGAGDDRAAQRSPTPQQARVRASPQPYQGLAHRWTPECSCAVTTHDVRRDGAGAPASARCRGSFGYRRLHRSYAPPPELRSSGGVSRVTRERPPRGVAYGNRSAGMPKLKPASRAARSGVSH
jgi:hypothetical protein